MSVGETAQLWTLQFRPGTSTGPCAGTRSPASQPSAPSVLPLDLLGRAPTGPLLRMICESTVSTFCAPFGSARTGAHGSPVTDDRRLEAVLAQYAPSNASVSWRKRQRRRSLI